MGQLPYSLTPAGAYHKTFDRNFSAQTVRSSSQPGAQFRAAPALVLSVMSDPTTPAPTSPDPASPTATRWRLLAVVLVAAQALVLVAFAVAWLVSLVRGAVELPQAVIGLAVVALVMAAVLAGAARGVWRRAAWTRAPVITFQLLLGIMGIEWMRGDALWIGLAAVVVAVAITAALLQPGVVERRGARFAD